MNEIENKNILNVYDMYKLMSENKIILIYQGLFDQEMVKSVLALTEKKLIKDNVIEGIRRKLFNIIMEGLQNICKHQPKSELSIANPYFVISKGTESFNIITGNMIENGKISIVTNKIDHINSLNPEELKELYKNARLNSVLSNVGGAGLGFIDMVRKSGNPLSYKIYPLNTTHSYFILNNTINKN